MQCVCFHITIRKSCSEVNHLHKNSFSMLPNLGSTVLPKNSFIHWVSSHKAHSVRSLHYLPVYVGWDAHLFCSHGCLGPLVSYTYARFLKEIYHKTIFSIIMRIVAVLMFASPTSLAFFFVLFYCLRVLNWIGKAFENCKIFIFHKCSPL